MTINGITPSSRTSSISTSSIGIAATCDLHLELCAVTNLLNGGRSLSQIADLQNQILDILIGSL